eukprot:gene4782-871_t
MEVANLQTGRPVQETCFVQLVEGRLPLSQVGEPGSSPPGTPGQCIGLSGDMGGPMLQSPGSHNFLGQNLSSAGSFDIRRPPEDVIQGFLSSLSQLGLSPQAILCQSDTDIDELLRDTLEYPVVVRMQLKIYIKGQQQLFMPPMSPINLQFHHQQQMTAQNPQSPAVASPFVPSVGQHYPPNTGMGMPNAPQQISRSPRQSQGPFASPHAHSMSPVSMSPQHPSLVSMHASTRNDQHQGQPVGSPQAVRPSNAGAPDDIDGEALMGSTMESLSRALLGDSTKIVNLDRSRDDYAPGGS